MQTAPIDTATDSTANLAQTDALKNDDVSLVDVLGIIAKRRRMIAQTVAIAALASTIIAFILPNRYTATTTLLPPQQPQSLTSALASQLGGVGMLGAVAGKDLGLKNPNDTYIGMLRSRVVADTLIQRFELMKVYRDKRLSDARNDLQSASDIQSGKDGFITVSVEDKDRKRAADIANAYIEELRRLTSSLAVTEAGQRRLFFEQQLQKAKDDLANAEVALKDTQQKTGLIQLDSQAKAIIESVAAVRAQIAAKEVQLQAMQSFATDQNPDVLLLRQELAGLRAQSARLENRSNAGAGDIQVPTGQVPQAGLEYVRRLRDVKYYETIFELLAKQFEVAKLDEARQGAVIQVVDPAVQPDKKSSPKRLLIVIVAVLAALAASVLWALFSEGISRMNADPDGARQLRALRQIFVPMKS
ncbi:MAG TPA: Wzz/FepE/Etk N-terminal domain-containing protein [Terriglobales bacterium]|nr:Wzz/FepE/Etk N-terminal domain-containing protein [Terriglobales bacterium]